MKVNKYGDYKKNRFVMELHSKIIYVIIDRNHSQRTVFLRPIETQEELNKYHQGRVVWSSMRNARNNMGNWRPLKELRKFYSLLDSKVMQVLYGTKA